MSKYIVSFFSFLFPILRSAIVQVAADELDRLAYPRRRPRSMYTEYARYDRQRRPEAKRFDGSDTDSAVFVRKGEQVNARIKLRQTQGFHDVLLVAFDLTGPNASVVHEWLQNQIPECGQYPVGKPSEGGVNLDSWWVANDERFDGSDTDSAVFVRKGEQVNARIKLRQYGLVD